MTDKPSPSGDTIEDQARAAVPTLISSGVEIVTALAGLLTGRKVVAIQSIARPIEDRDDAGSPQWDHYVRVMDQVDPDETAGNA